MQTFSERQKAATGEITGPDDLRQVPASLIEPVIRLSALALLLFWAVILIRPFIVIGVWSIVLAVALYPLFKWVSNRLGGSPKLAAILITFCGLLIIVGPVTWLVLALVEGLRLLAAQLEAGGFAIPAPPSGVKLWPFVGVRLYEFWDLAATNFKAAAREIIPQLKPLGSGLLEMAASAGTGILQFFVSVIVAGFLFIWGPGLITTVKALSRRMDSSRGEKFLELTGSTIRAISRGVIGVSLLQSLLAGIGLLAANVPVAGLITLSVLILGILQIGPSIVLVPVIIWSWLTMDTTVAILLTAYLIPVNLMDNILRPIAMSRGLSTPMPVILLGAIGGMLAHGLVGLFLGPVVLGVVWELLVAWAGDEAGSDTSNADELR